MGCYGIGITRLLQALVEHTLTVNEGRMLWPRSVAPFSVCIVPLASTEVCVCVCVCVLHGAYAYMAASLTKGFNVDPESSPVV